MTANNFEIIVRLVGNKGVYVLNFSPMEMLKVTYPSFPRPTDFKLSKKGKQWRATSLTETSI